MDPIQRIKYVNDVILEINKKFPNDYKVFKYTQSMLDLINRNEYDRCWILHRYISRKKQLLAKGFVENLWSIPDFSSRSDQEANQILLKYLSDKTKSFDLLPNDDFVRILLVLSARRGGELDITHPRTWAWNNIIKYYTFDTEIEAKNIYLF